MPGVRSSCIILLFALTASVSAQQSPAVATQPSLAPAPAPSSAEVLGPAALRSSAQDAIFQVYTGKKASAMESYGTAFVVDAVEGLLATNFHVISEALIRPKEHSLFVRVDTRSVPVRVVAFSTPDDLALIKVDDPFPKKAFPFSQAALRPGERSYSLGLPEDTVMTLIEGLFSDHSINGPYRALVLSTPLNHGMSGGPTLNDRGEVIGINDATLNGAQNISFAVPLARLLVLISHYHEKTAPWFVAPEGTSFLNQIAEQLRSFSATWLSSWTASPEASLALANWTIETLPSGMSCWQSPDRSDSKNATVEHRLCSTKFSAFVDEGLSAGRLDLEYFSVTPLKGDAQPLQPFFRNLAAYMTRAENDFKTAPSYRKSDDSPLQMQRFVCRHEIVQNAHGLKLLVESCQKSLTPYPLLYDTLIRATSIGPSRHGIIAQMRAQLFDGPATIKAIQYFLDGIVPR